MNISILLPYKENYSQSNAGAVSIFVNDTTKISKFRKNINVYGSTESKKVLNNYKNINFKKNFFQSSSEEYLKSYLKNTKNSKIDLIEIHNRPHYVNFLKDKINYKIFLYFHNDPLKMNGSRSVDERVKLIENTDKIIFNSFWSKSRFLVNLNKKINLNHLVVVHQSTSKTKIDFKKKKKIISFVGKLNTSKGFDIFGKAIIKILKKHPEWKALVIGDEPRQKFYFNHKNLIHMGFKKNSYVLNKLKEVSIAVVPSRWDEPFGRSSLEAASRGCAIIMSNTGGLSETTNHSLIIKNLNHFELYKKIDFLIKQPKKRLELQKKIFKNFVLDNKYASDKIDGIRQKHIINKVAVNKSNLRNIKILHITNFNERFDGRLHYNTGKRINNGLIRLGHNVLTMSDRDIIYKNKTLNDLKGINSLNKKILNCFENFNPDLIIIGHADNINQDTLSFLKNKKKSLKIAQWFLDPLSNYLPDYKKNKKRILKNIDNIDSTFLTSNPKSVEFKIKNSYFIPNPCDISFETLSNYNYECENDLFFAMSHGVHRGVLKKNKFDKREIILQKLIDNKKDIIVDFYGLNNNQPIWADKFINQLSKSKMGLNLSRGKPLKYYSSDRIAQLMGNGLLTFVDNKTYYSDFFNKNEIVTYDNISDLIEKICKYKKDDKKRRLIAKNGKIKYFKLFNSTNVSDYIIKKTFDIKSKFYW